jgi:hypothetical protein
MTPFNAIIVVYLLIARVIRAANHPLSRAARGLT